MPTLEPLTRTYYFDGELLSKDDFVREQQYVRDLVRYQNAFLFTPGVVGGLELSGGNGDETYTVTAGLAFNEDGVPILLDEDLEQGIDTDLSDGEHFVSIVYSDEMATSAGDESMMKLTRSIKEVPEVYETDSAPSPPNVILGKFQVTDGKIDGTVDTSVCERSTVRLDAVANPVARLLAARSAPPAVHAATGASPPAGADPLLIQTIHDLTARVEELERRLAGNPGAP